VARCDGPGFGRGLVHSSYCNNDEMVEPRIWAIELLVETDDRDKLNRIIDDCSQAACSAYGMQTIADAAKLPSLTGNSESPLHIGLVICLLLAVATAIVLERSTFGLRLRAIGLNELAARRAGMPGGILLVVALAMAGAFGGLAGAIMLQGEQYYLKTGFSSGYGFDGLVVGLLSRGSTLGVLAGALFFGFLRSGGISMEIMAQVPAALTLVIQGLIVIAVAGSVILVEKLQGGR